MSKNLNQIFIANPAAAMLSTDLFYLARSPFGATNDMGITWANVLASIAAQASGTWGISISGNAATATSATSATNATNIGTTANSTNASFYPLFVSSNAGGNQAAQLGTGLSFNPSTNALTTTTFIGDLTGNATTATSATNATNGATVATTTNASFFPLFAASSTNGNQPFNLGTGITFNPSTNTLTTTTFVGSLTGNASTATSAANALTWNNIAGTTQAAAVQNAYIIGNAGQTTVTLPATAALGAIVAVQGLGAAGWILTANTGQTIKLGSSTTSSAGSLTSTNQYDSIEVVCIVANTTWATRSVIGNLTVT